MPKVVRLIFVALVAYLSLSAGAQQMYKCRQENGTFSFQAEKCDEGAAQQILAKDRTGALKVVKPAEKPSTSPAPVAPPPPATVTPRADAPALNAPIAVAPITAAPSAATEPANPTSSVANPTVAPQEPATKNSAASERMIQLFAVAVGVGVFIVMLLPIKLVATLVGAERRGLFTCFVALIIAVFFGGMYVALDGLYQTKYVTILAAALIYMWLFKTSYVKALLIVVPVGLFYILAPQSTTVRNLLAKSEKMVEFSPPDYSYSINMPGRPTQQEASESGTTYQLRSNGWGYQVYFYDLKNTSPERPVVLDRTREALVKILQGTLVSQNLAILGGNNCREVLIQGADGYLHQARYFINDGRLYVAMIAIPKGQDKSPKIDAFFDSFHLHTRH